MGCGCGAQRRHPRTGCAGGGRTGYRGCLMRRVLKYAAIVLAVLIAACLISQVIALGVATQKSKDDRAELHAKLSEQREKTSILGDVDEVHGGHTMHNPDDS